jgi:hypothetical protein
MDILGFIGAIFKPAVDLVDELNTSKEEKLQLRNTLVAMQNELATKVLDYEKSLNESRARIIEAEATGQSWLQRNWRPILMLTIVAIVANNYLIYPYLSMFTAKAVVLELPEPLFTLMTVGVGGYIIGRSGEKIMKTYKSTHKSVG